MLSSANLDFTFLLIHLALLLFGSAGVFYSLVLGIVHIVQKKTNSLAYYLRMFLVSGVIGLTFWGLIVVIWLLSLDL